MLRELATDEADLAQLRGLASGRPSRCRSATRGAPFGALSLIVGSSGRRYAPGRPRVREARPGPDRDRARQHRPESCRRAQRGDHERRASTRSRRPVTMNGPDGTTVYANQAGGPPAGGDERRGGPQRPAGRDRRALRRSTTRRAGRTTTATCPRSARSRARSTRAPGSCATSSWRRARSAGCSTRSASCATPTAAWTGSSTSSRTSRRSRTREVRQRILGEATRVLSAAPDREQGPRGRRGGRRPGPGGVVRGRRADGPAASAGRRRSPATSGSSSRCAAGGGELRDADARPGAVVLRGGPRPGRGARSARAASPSSTPGCRSERAEITRDLQEGLRPPELPAVPGCGRRRCTARRGSSTTSAATSTTPSRPTRADGLHRRRRRPGCARGDPDRAHALHAAVRRAAHRRAQDRDRGGQPRADRAARARARHARRGPAAPTGPAASSCSGRSRPATRCRCSSATAPCASSAHPVRSPGSSRTPSGR